MIFYFRFSKKICPTILPKIDYQKDKYSFIIAENKIMFPAKIPTKVEKQKDVERIFQTLQQNFDVEKRLFSIETRISIAYCDSLFEAGILHRLESERIKNGLQTILKRADFDKNYFDSTEALDIFQFIDEKLQHLVGELGLKIQIGRSPNDRGSTALRFWLREEIVLVYRILREIQEFFLNFAEQNKETIFLIKDSSGNSKPILFAHWCLAKFEIFKNDRERLDEVWRRINIMTLGSNHGTGTSLEYDREELAAKLGFQGISNNSLEAFHNQDYIVEFVNANSLVSTHLRNFIDELTEHIKSQQLSFEKEFNDFYPELIYSKLTKIFGYQVELNADFHTFSQNNNSYIKGNLEAIFALVDLLKNCLLGFQCLLENIKINEKYLKLAQENYRAEISEISEYLIQRNETLPKALHNAVKIQEKIALDKNVGLQELKQISDNIEQDFFEEMSLAKIINNKNQIGGTAFECVMEALEDARKSLQYEE